MRVCVIGMGPIGNRHADIYRENKSAELVGVCDILKDRADAAAKRLGVPGFYEAGKMLDAIRPDLVSVATGGYEYGSDHYEPTMQALEAGCHVLCEKPICNEIAQAEAMVAKAREKNRCFGINMNHRFTPAARLAKKWVDEGRLGHLLFVNMSMWIKNPAESSPYFQIKALHPHTVDVMRYYCGDVEAVQCFATKAPGRTIWTTAHFSLRFANGVVGGLTGSYDIERGHPMERCEVAGTGGRFVLEDMFRELTLYPAGNLEKTVYSNPVFGGMRDFADTFRNRINAFVEQVAGGASPDRIDGSGAAGLAAQKVLAAAIESLENETVVHVGDAIHVGVLGFAHGHVNSYCAAWGKDPALGVRVVAGWDHDAARLAAAVKQHGVEPCASPAELLLRPDVAAVVIAAETSMHAELVEQAAAGCPGKAIVVQKPLALTIDEADRIVAAVARSGVRFSLAWQMRVDPQNVRMRELVRGGELGRLFMVRRRHGLSTHTWAGFEDSWHVAPQLNRDIWADDSSHPIDLIYWMLGMPASVTAELGSLANPKIPNDNGIAIFRYADGTIGEVCCSFTSLAGENTTEIIAERGVVIQSYGDGPSAAAPRPAGAVGLKWYLGQTKQWTASDIASPAGQGERIAALAGPLAEFLRGRRPPIATAEEGRDVLRLVLACYESAGRGQRVYLDAKETR